MAEITDHLENFLRQKKRGFVSTSDLQKGLPRTFWDRIGPKKPKTAGDVRKALTPYLGSRLVFLSKGKSFLLAVGKSDEKWFLDAVQDAPGITPNALLKNVPYVKADFMEILNRLLEQGRLRVKLNDDYKPRFYPFPQQSVSCPPAVSAAAVPHPPSSAPQDPARLAREFEAAFRELNRAKIFVRIFALRRRLGWSEEVFDATLRRLRDERKIQLHTGDIASMTQEDIADSFRDENNFLMLTLTWSPS